MHELLLLLLLVIPTTSSISLTTFNNELDAIVEIRIPGEDRNYVLVDGYFRPYPCTRKDLQYLEIPKNVTTMHICAPENIDLKKQLNIYVGLQPS